MNIVDLIEGASLGEPKIVIPGYFGPVDGQRVDDPLEMRQAIKNAESCREVPWADARAGLLALGNKCAPVHRVDTASHTLLVENRGDGWFIADHRFRLGRR